MKKKRAEWLTFATFIIVVLFALYILLEHGGFHGRSAAFAVALLAILLLRVVVFVWNLKRQRNLNQHE